MSGWVEGGPTPPLPSALHHSGPSPGALSQKGQPGGEPRRQERTVADAWGRVVSPLGCATAANVGKVGALHGMVLLPVHRPGLPRHGVGCRHFF